MKVEVYNRDHQLVECCKKVPLDGIKCCRDGRFLISNGNGIHQVPRGYSIIVENGGNENVAEKE